MIYEFDFDFRLDNEQINNNNNNRNNNNNEPIHFINDNDEPIHYIGNNNNSSNNNEMPMQNSNNISGAQDTNNATISIDDNNNGHIVNRTDGRIPVIYRPFGGVGGNAADNEMTIGAAYVPSDNDVLCGKGTKYYNHTGTKRFRMLIAKHLDMYLSLERKREKDMLFRKIAGGIRDVGGLFLRKDDQTDDWIDIGDKMARQKVRFALRDAKKERARKHNSKVACCRVKKAVSSKLVAFTKTTDTKATDTKTPSTTTTVPMVPLEKSVSQSNPSSTGARKSDNGHSSESQSPTDRLPSNNMLAAVMANGLMLHWQEMTMATGLPTESANNNHNSKDGGTNTGSVSVGNTTMMDNGPSTGDNSCFTHMAALTAGVGGGFSGLPMTNDQAQHPNDDLDWSPIPFSHGASLPIGEDLCSVWEEL